MKIRAMIVIFTLLVLILLSFFGLSIILTPGTNDQVIYIEIPKGSNSNQIASLLKENGVIRRELDFKITSRLLSLGGKFKAGRYRFSPRPMLITVLQQISAGKTVGVEPVRITFPEGTSIYKMGSILEKNQIPCYADFRELTRRRLEGYLYPDTYIFNPDISAEALANLMRKRFDQVILPYYEAHKQATKYNLHQVLTLASIIEKEAAQERERPIISSVFHNRLNINMALDSCSTVKYALERPTKVVYFDQLRYPSPYNTYLHRGLPPGPICNPGINSIKAAIYPAKTDYLYFVANKDGSHTFSSSFGGHQKARVKKR